MIIPDFSWGFEDRRPDENQSIKREPCFHAAATTCGDVGVKGACAWAPHSLPSRGQRQGDVCALALHGGSTHPVDMTQQETLTSRGLFKLAVRRFVSPLCVFIQSHTLLPLIRPQRKQLNPVSVQPCLLSTAPL